MLKSPRAEQHLFDSAFNLDSVSTDFGRADCGRIGVPALALVGAYRRHHGLGGVNADFGRVVVQALAF